MTLIVKDTEDPFASVTEVMQSAREEIITGGRYRLPNRDGSHKNGGWQRVTKLVSAISDQFGLRIWEMAEMIKGIAWDASLYEDLCSIADRLPQLDRKRKQEVIEAFVEKCKRVSGGDAGSKFGNKRHAQVEADHEDRLPAGATDAFARRHLYLYRAALIRHKLRALPGMQERRILISALGAIGTLDNVLEDETDSQLGIGDLKTQKRFWHWLEIEAQFACYAHGEAMWEPSEAGGRNGRWVDMPPVRQDIGYLLWMPREPIEPDAGWQPHVDVYEVDIVNGWKTAVLAHKVVQRRSSATISKSMTMIRPAPPASLTEKYAARFAAVDTKAEGAALVKEAIAAGVWSQVLADEAKLAAERVGK